MRKARASEWVSGGVSWALASAILGGCDNAGPTLYVTQADFDHMTVVEPIEPAGDHRRARFHYVFATLQNDGDGPYRRLSAVIEVDCAHRQSRTASATIFSPAGKEIITQTAGDTRSRPFTATNPELRVVCEPDAMRKAATSKSLERLQQQYDRLRRQRQG